MSSKQEIVVSESSPLPKDYAFLRKGDAYKTLHCRKLTHEAGKPLYVVENRKHKVGIRVPRHIFLTVQNLARETAPTRLAATARRDAALNQEAEAELKRLYPAMPSIDLGQCLRRAFRKHSGRVGRSGQMHMARKAELAVMAHIRHQHTDYDKLLKNGMSREEARRKVIKDIFRIMREWGAKAVWGAEAVWGAKAAKAKAAKAKAAKAAKAKGAKATKAAKSVKGAEAAKSAKSAKPAKEEGVIWISSDSEDVISISSDSDSEWTP